MSISVIIAHFAPKFNGDKYFNLLRDNINNLRNQIYDQNIEIIICDDGSYWTKDLYEDRDTDEILVLGEDEIKNSNLFTGLLFDKYYGLPDVNKYRAIRLKVEAIERSKYDKIVILDDDHPFLNNNSIGLFSNYLDKFSYVKGRLIGPNNLPQLYISRNAQGTTYGFKKELYLKMNGFSEFLYDNAFGEDNDILYRFYKIITDSQNTLKGCFAGDVITKDLATNRWDDRVKSMEGDNKIIFNANNVRERFVDNFIEEHGVHPTKGNPSRIRYGWLSMSSVNSWLYEVKFMFYYLIYFKEFIKVYRKPILSKLDSFFR